MRRARNMNMKLIQGILMSQFSKNVRLYRFSDISSECFVELS